METLYKNYEKILRLVPTEEKILKSVRRVQVFNGSDLLAKLKECNIKQDAMYQFVTYMLVDNKIFKVKVDKNQCDILLDYRFVEKDQYIWAEEKTSGFNSLLCLGVIIIGLCLVMMQMWPSKLKVVYTYISYLCGGFIVFLLVLGVLRLLIFGITYVTHSPGIWLFPNLFADCGFVDSFIPLWSYHGVCNDKNKQD